MEADMTRLDSQGRSSMASKGMTLNLATLVLQSTTRSLLAL